MGKSSKKERIAENLAVVRLSDEDMKTLDGLELEGTEGRTIDFSEQVGVKLFTN